MKKRRKNLEDIMHKTFAQKLLQLEALNQLNCTHWHYSCNGENRDLITGSLLKAKGAGKGQADYMFIHSAPTTFADDVLYSEQKKKYYITWIEFKVLDGSYKGKQNDSQEIFEEKFPNDYFIAYSVDEAFEILQKRKVILCSI